MKRGVADKDSTHSAGRVFFSAIATAWPILLMSTASLSAGNTSVAAPPSAAELVHPLGTAAPHQITGMLQKIDGSTLTVITRKGASVSVSDVEAIQTYRAAPLVTGNAFIFGGNYDSRGKLLATIILRAKNSSAAWPEDR
jgi:hypothetical protein